LASAICRVVLGHDDASALRALEVLLGDALPALRR